MKVIEMAKSDIDKLIRNVIHELASMTAGADATLVAKIRAWGDAEEDEHIYGFLEHWLESRSSVYGDETIRLRCRNRKKSPSDISLKIRNTLGDIFHILNEPGIARFIHSWKDILPDHCLLDQLQQLSIAKLTECKRSSTQYRGGDTRPHDP